MWRNTGNADSHPRVCLVGGASAGDPAPHSYGAIELCLSKSGTATITSLVPQGGSGLTVLDYATRPGSSSFGASQRTLAQEGFPSSHVVAASCANGQLTEISLTVQRTGLGNGRFEVLRINYDSAGKHRSLVLPFSLKVCGPDGRTTAGCGDAKSP